MLRIHSSACASNIRESAIPYHANLATIESHARGLLRMLKSPLNSALLWSFLITVNYFMPLIAWPSLCWSITNRIIMSNGLFGTPASVVQFSLQTLAVHFHVSQAPHHLTSRLDLHLNCHLI